MLIAQHRGKECIMPKKYRLSDFLNTDWQKILFYNEDWACLWYVQDIVKSVLSSYKPKWDIESYIDEYDNDDIRAELWFFYKKYKSMYRSLDAFINNAKKYWISVL